MLKNYKHLTIEERTVIQIGLSIGLLPAQIAVELDRSTSTVTRELQRNGWVRPVKIKSRGRPSVSGGYSAPIAHAKAVTCVIKPRVQSRLQLGNALWKLGYSPEQVSGTLPRNHLHSHLCHAPRRATHGGGWLAAPGSC